MEPVARRQWEKGKGLRNESVFKACSPLPVRSKKWGWENARCPQELTTKGPGKGSRTSQMTPIGKLLGSLFGAGSTCGATSFQQIQVSEDGTGEETVPHVELRAKTPSLSESEEYHSPLPWTSIDVNKRTRDTGPETSRSYQLTLPAN